MGVLSHDVCFVSKRAVKAGPVEWNRNIWQIPKYERFVLCINIALYTEKNSLGFLVFTIR